MTHYRDKLIEILKIINKYEYEHPYPVPKKEYIQNKLKEGNMGTSNTEINMTINFLRKFETINMNNFSLTKFGRKILMKFN